MVLLISLSGTLLEAILRKRQYVSVVLHYHRKLTKMPICEQDDIDGVLASATYVDGTQQSTREHGGRGQR